MIKLLSEIERELSKVAQRETKSVLDVTNTSGDSSLIIWDSSHEDKFVFKKRYQPEPGPFFPRFLWGGEVKDPGNEVEVPPPPGICHP